jgi:hypothetical protein
MRDAVVLEVAVSLTLLVGAGLLMHSFLMLREVNLGLQADHVFETTLLLPPDSYKTADQVSTFFRPAGGLQAPIEPQVGTIHRHRIGNASPGRSVSTNADGADE